MKEPIYFRKGHIIKDASRTVVFEGKQKSINAAKRESRRLQLKEDGALGRGSLKVYRR